MSKKEVRIKPNLFSHINQKICCVDCGQTVWGLQPFIPEDALKKEYHEDSNLIKLFNLICMTCNKASVRLDVTNPDKYTLVDLDNKFIKELDI